MKNKKAIIIVVLLIVIVLLAGMVIAAIRNKNFKDEKRIHMPKDFVITYSYGGGFTTYANSLTRAISIDQDGTVTIQLDEKDSQVEPIKYSIGKEKAEEIMRFFLENNFEKVKKDLSQKDVTDLDTSYLEIKSDTVNRKIGGYAASINEKFRLFSRKFISYIDENKLSEFNNNVTKAYEKSNE